ncbi:MULTISPECIES: hypothetical protein [Nostocales]|uniref:Uncharacterized protein n=4 Tax=Nostocales TaxID=1161 RepID=A0A8S9TAU3_9CYAN|nr:hypothetical protein [Tolypothrix bouteillei]KAF3889286.1 hypothetical protein DA73_0400030245 [Tolypothrix bouteillei VB521301]
MSIRTNRRKGERCNEKNLDIMTAQTFFYRYLAGDRESVWKELQALGEIVEPSLKADALAVARETMRRAKLNLEIIVHRLKKLGFEFSQPEQVIVPVQSQTLQLLDDVEQQWGTLPFSVRAWYECIHSVELFASKPISKDLIESLEPTAIALSFSSCSNLSDDLDDTDELRWYIQGMTFLSLEESLTKVLESKEKFRQDWREGKVDDWTRNYCLQNKIDPEVLTVDFLPVGMSMSTCEPMGFEVGMAKADCTIADDGDEMGFVDFLRERLLLGGLLHGHCAKNHLYDYLYIGKMPNHLQITSEVFEELLLF